MWRLPIPEFKVLVYGAGLPSAGLRARAHFEPGVLVIEGKGHWYTVPADGIALKTGGYDGRQWMIGWNGPSGPMTALLQGDDTVDIFIRVAPPEVSAGLRSVRQESSLRERRFRVAMAVLAFLALSPLFALGLYWMFADGLSRWAADQIGVQQEVRLGEMAFGQVRRSLKLVEEGEAHDAVELIGVRLTAGTGRYRYAFHVARDPQVNAFALPGGHIVVFTGLIQATESAEELAGVLAHEISHVERRHALRSLIHGLGWRAVLGVALWDFTGAIWGDMAGELARLSYSRELELEADREGVNLLRRTGLPAGGMARFFGRLEARGEAPPALLSTHPTDLERQSALTELVGGLGDYPSQPIAIDWDRVKRDIARLPVK